MFRKVLIFILLLFPFAITAAGETVMDNPPGTFVKKAVKTAKTVDRYLEKRQRKQTTDTSYIFKPQEKWLFRTRSDVILTLLDFDRNHPADVFDFSMDLKSNPRFRQHIGVGYRGVVLGFGIGIPFKNSDKELSFKVYANQAGGEITYGTIESLKGTMNIGDVTYEMKPGNLLDRYLRVGAYYAFNWDRFSMPAAMSQSHIQRRSAGSPLASFAFRMVWNTYPYERRHRLTPETKTQSFFIGVGGGYGYNWVPTEHWLLHISATETIGLGAGSRIYFANDTYRYRERFLPLVTAVNAAVIYYYKRFYFGAFGTVDNLFIPSRERNLGEDLNLSMSRISGHLTVGVRL